MLKNIEARVGFFVLIAIAVLAYMGFQIGAFRFDSYKYNSYELYFKDISGLTRKAQVKIAGVKVGWVEKIVLQANDQLLAQATVFVHRDYPLYTDAHAIVRQDGLLGPKFIELVAGSALLAELPSGSPLQKPSIEPVSIDDLLMQVKGITTNILEVSESFKSALGGEEGQEQLRGMVGNIAKVAERFATFSDVLESTILQNGDSISDFLSIGTNIKDLTNKLQSDVLPTFQSSIEKISDVFDRDFDRIASVLGNTGEALQNTVSEAKSGFASISAVADKINDGKGLIGKLINDDSTYNDLRFAVQGFKNYIGKMDRLEIVFDSHFESMHRVAENYRYEDSKGYFDIRIHPNQDYFYLVQLATSEKGRLARKEWIRSYVQPDLQPIDVAKLDVSGFGLLAEALRKQEIRIKRNTLTFGLQFGKIFNDIAVRFGLFEGSAGLGVDVDIPFRTDKLRWLTTFEMFDLTGQNRIDDRRPHLKWLNKMYLGSLRNLYFTFGADDFASKRNASGFVGGGIRFGDDDVKYLMSGLSGMVGSVGK